jgi:2-phospho-L-lactate guanylyltransferase
MNVLLPIRDPSLAKTRLGEGVDEQGRQRIYRKLVNRTVDVIQNHASDFTVYLMCPEPEQEAWGDLPNVAWIDDTHPGHLARGITQALESWEPPALVLMPDLPLLSANDLSATLKQTSDLVWIPDRSGRGTNGLIWRSGSLPYLAFGRADSMRVHLNATRAPRLYRKGLAWDLDVPADLVGLPEGEYR